MTANEAIAKYQFITKVLLKSENGELSNEMKIKVMTMRIELSKIKKSYDADAKEFADNVITDEFRNLAQKQDKTEEEEKEFKNQEEKINQLYSEFLAKLGAKEVDVNATFTEDEYNELVPVNIDNNIVINGNNINSADFLEIIYSLFVE